jgi:hypothetical protein
MLIEDEHDTVNVIVAAKDHERDRRTVRTELLIVVEDAWSVIARRPTRSSLHAGAASGAGDFALSPRRS